MREIKFRAWDKEHQDIHNWEELLNLWDNFDALPFGEEQYIYMQYTGLKDKNGKEIYEGDIVDVPAIYDETGKIRVKAIIKWDDIFTGFAIFRDDDTDSLNKFDIKRDKLEVIGNIYENKELLK